MTAKTPMSPEGGVHEEVYNIDHIYDYEMK